MPIIPVQNIHVEIQAQIKICTELWQWKEGLLFYRFFPPRLKGLLKLLFYKLLYMSTLWIEEPPTTYWHQCGIPQVFHYRSMCLVIPWSTRLVVPWAFYYRSTHPVVNAVTTSAPSILHTLVWELSSFRVLQHWLLLHQR